MNRILLLLTIFIFGCSQKDDENELKSPQFFIDLIKVKAETIQELNKIGLYPNGIGEGGISCIESVFYGFVYRKAIDINQARELMVKAIDIALEKINAEEKIQLHLCNYPFTAENIEIHIDLTKNDKIIEKKKVKIVNFISLGKGKIIYEYTNFDEIIFEELLVETYLEAKNKIIQAQDIKN